MVKLKVHSGNGPWDKDNVGKTLEERTLQFQNLVGTLSAMNGELKAKIAKRLLKSSKGSNPNYELINQSNEGMYDSEIANDVRKIIEEHYDTKNELSPLNKSFDGTKADYLTKQMVVNIYHGHKQSLIDGIGRKDYHLVIEDAERNNLREVQGKLVQAASAGYMAEAHGDDVVKHLIDAYKIDKKKINIDLLKRQAPHLIGRYITGSLNADEIYSQAPKYDRKKKKSA